MRHSLEAKGLSGVSLELQLKTTGGRLWAEPAMGCGLFEHSPGRIGMSWKGRMAAFALAC
jgi:hypothetical protein